MRESNYVKEKDLDPGNEFPNRDKKFPGKSFAKDLENSNSNWNRREEDFRRIIIRKTNKNKQKSGEII